MDSPLFTRFLPFLDSICIHRNSRDVADVAPFFVYLLLHSRSQLHIDEQGALLLQGPDFEQAFGTHAQDVRRAVEILWDPTFPREREKLLHIQTLLHTAGDTAIESLRTVYLDAAKAVLAVPAVELRQALPDLWMEILSELRPENYYLAMRDPRCYVHQVRSAFLSLALHMYAPKEGDRVYIPFAAPEEYIPMLSKQQVVAQDALPLRWAIGTLTLLAQGCQGFSYRLESSALAWQGTGDFDLLLLTASQYKLDYASAQAIGSYLGHRVVGDGNNHPLHYEYTRYGVHALQFVMERAFSALKEHGRAVVVLPAHFLWQQSGDKTPQVGYWESVRRRLIAQDLLEVVILLPKERESEYCLIGLDRKKVRQGYFRLMDARSYVEEKTNMLQHLQILRQLEKDEAAHLATVPLGHLQYQDYKLTPMRYLWRKQIPEELKQYPLRSLSDFMTPMELTRYRIPQQEEGQQVRGVTFRQMYSYVRNTVLASQVGYIDEEHLPYTRTGLVAKESCLLVNSFSDSIRSIWFEADVMEEESPIYFFEVDAYRVESILPGYLVWILEQDFIRAQIEVARYEGLDMMSAIHIPYPPVEVQEAKGMPAKNTYLV